MDGKRISRRNGKTSYCRKYIATPCGTIVRIRSNQTTPESLLVDSPPKGNEFDAKAQNISNLYITAIERADDGERTVCIDEMTGIQALLSKEKDLPLRPGKVKRREARVYPSWNAGINSKLYMHLNHS